MNNKAFTTVELILTMAHVIVIIATITSVTLVYRDRLDYEEEISLAKNYKNTVTKIIYDDILDQTNKVTSLETIEENKKYALVKKDNTKVNLEILNDIPNKQIGIMYDDVKYIVPGVDRDLIEFQSVEVITKSNYTAVNIYFLSKKYKDPLTIHFIISNT